MDQYAYEQLLRDLKAESDHLIGHLQGLSCRQWSLDTPAAGWGINDQVTHLAFFDDATAIALQRPSEFREFADALMAEGMDFPDRIAKDHRKLAPDAVLTWFDDSRTALLDVLSSRHPRDRMPWFGPEMSAASAATARLMETWAHAQDVYDALGVNHPPSSGLRSIAHLGVATFAFSHRLHGVEIPAEPVSVALDAPDGDLWTWGPHPSDDHVRGAGEDFVLVVTQRRHWTETGLVVEGDAARRWLDIAQAFAGAPSRRPQKMTP